MRSSTDLTILPSRSSRSTLVAWVLTAAGVDREALLAELAAALPPPRRNPLLRVERRLGQRVRRRDLVRRYQHTTGRTATAGPTIAALING